MELKPHQKKAVKFILNKKKCAIFFEMGLGKTALTLYTINFLLEKKKIRKTLIITPLKVVSTWLKELEKFGFDHIKPNENFYVINPEKIKKFFSSGSPSSFDFIVFDESTLFKNPQSKRLKIITSILKKNASSFRFRVVLTGTPTTKDCRDLWSQFYLLDEGKRLEKNFTRFKNLYFNTGESFYLFRPRKGALEEIKEKIKDISISLKSKEVISLPKLFKKNIYINVSDQNFNEQYRSLEKDFILFLKDADKEKDKEKDTEKIPIAQKVVRLNKLRQIASGFIYDMQKNPLKISEHKIKTIKYILKNIDTPAIIVYEFKAELMFLQEHFKNLEVFKPEIMQKWNNKEIPLLALQSQSCSYGLNLQKGGSIMIWSTPTWSFEKYTQMNARIYRSGQKNNCKIFNLITKNTVEQYVHSVLAKKKTNLSEIFRLLKKDCTLNMGC